MPWLPKKCVIVPIDFSDESFVALDTALEMVDFVTIFDEVTPVKALDTLRPDIHCKGAEYADGARPVPERETVLGYGGQIRFLPFHAGRSTSGIVDRIRQAMKSEESTCSQ